MQSRRDFRRSRRKICQWRSGSILTTFFLVDGGGGGGGRTDNSLALNAGLVALLFSRGSGTVLLKRPISL